MVTEAKGKQQQGAVSQALGLLRVEAIITVDERGQMGLPQETRARRGGIKAGDKLAVTSWEGRTRGMLHRLIKAGNLESMVKGILGPVMGDILGK